MAQEKILYIADENTVTYHSGTLTPSSDRDVKELFSAATVPLSHLSTHTLKLPNHLSEEEQKIQVEIRMFEEGNLDSNEEYTIDYIRHDLPDENSYLFKVFAISHAKAAEYFANPLSKLGVIDRIVPGIIIYESLYESDSLPKQSDLFLFFGKEESYAALYQNGYYIAHRSLDSLSSLAMESGLDVAELILTLAQRGVIEANYPQEEVEKCTLLQDILSRNIERLVHTINHKRGLFGFSDIHHIYLDFQGHSIAGIETIFNAYGIENVPISPLARTPHSPQEFHHLLCAEYLSKHITDTSLNLSPFRRKDPWYKRPSGKFLGFIAVALFIALWVPLSLSWLIANEKETHASLKSRLEQMRSASTELARTLNERKQQLTQHQSQWKGLKGEMVMLEETQKITEQIAQMHFQRQQMVMDVTSQLGRYRLGTLMMEQNGSKEMSLQVVAEYNKRDDIAKVMNDLYLLGYQNVEAREIALDKNNYNAVIKVTR